MGMPWTQVTNPGTSSAGAQVPYTADWMETPFNAAFSVNLTAGGSATFNVESTMGDVVNLGTAGVVWDQVISAATAAVQGAITTPVRAVRVNYTSGPTTSSCTLRIIQGMSSR